MITQIKIENYKSILSLDLDLGRVNVLIGENGSGKTNILEAVALGSAAAEDNLEDSYLSIKGIRLSEPKMMKPGFTSEQVSEVAIEFSGSAKKKYRFVLSNDGKPFSKWINKGGFTSNVGEILKFLKEKNLPVFGKLKKTFSES